jgi:Flp pilus assembly pilin Flp
MKKLFALIRGEEGQDMAEYALLLSLIAIVVAVTVTLLGPVIAGVFTAIGVSLGA